jgi:hypothetical protein
MGKKGTKLQSKKVIVTYVKSDCRHERKVCMSLKDMHSHYRTDRGPKNESVI